jgi:hypothetical protein
VWVFQDQMVPFLEALRDATPIPAAGR